MSPLSARLWSVLQRQESAGHMEHLQWVPAHCGLPGNKQADALTKEATGLIQQDTPFDARTLAGATARRAKRSWLAGRPKGWYPSIKAPRQCGAPPEKRRWTSISFGWATGDARSSIITASVDVPPISANSAVTPAARRFGVWSAGSPQTPAHILLECPYLLGLRLRSIFNIFATESDIRKGDLVADLAAGYTVYKSRGRCMERIELEILSHIAENIRRPLLSKILAT